MTIKWCSSSKSPTPMKILDRRALSSRILFSNNRLQLFKLAGTKVACLKDDSFVPPVKRYFNLHQMDNNDTFLTPTLVKEQIASQPTFRANFEQKTTLFTPVIKHICIHQSKSNVQSKIVFLIEQI